MGICASCLGLTRRPSQDIDENDPLLGDQQTQYGGIGGGDVSQPGEEELRREREELEHITTEATDNMIDVLHPGNTDISHRFAHYGSHRMSTPAAASDDTPIVGEESDDEESTWLRSVQALTSEDVTTVQGLESGSLILDASQLRVEAPGPAPKKSSKGKLPA